MRLKSLLTFLTLTLVLIVAACAPATPVLPQPGTTPGTDGGVTIPETGADPAQLEEQVRNNVTQFLTTQLNAAAGAVESISLTEVDWPDACLGLPRENENCAQVVTPGWRVAATIQGQQYVLRTNRDASIVRFDPGTQGVDDQDVTPVPGFDDDGMDDLQTTPVPDMDQDGQQATQAPGTGTGDQGAGQGVDQTATVAPGDTDEGGQDTGDTGTGTGTGDQGDTGTGTGTGDQSGPGAAQPTMDIRPPDEGDQGDTGEQGDTGGQTGAGAIPTTGEIQLFLVRAAGAGTDMDTGQQGESFGTCGDTLVGVPANIQDSGDLADNVRRTYQALLDWNEASFEGMNLTSGLASSENMRVDSVTVGADGKAFVRLSGDFGVQDECDPDRVLYQLRQAGLQFEGIQAVEIFVNNRELESYFSEISR